MISTASRMETMTEFEADAIGAAMLLLTEALDVIA